MEVGASMSQEDRIKELESEVWCYEDAVKRLVAAKDDPEKLKSLVEQLDEFGPRGPVGIGLGRFGGHAIG